MVPVVVGQQDRDRTRRTAERFARGLRAGHILVLPDARHEILSERDGIREDFWAAFDAFMPGSEAAERAGEAGRGLSLTG